MSGKKRKSPSEESASISIPKTEASEFKPIQTPMRCVVRSCNRELKTAIIFHGTKHGKKKNLYACSEDHRKSYLNDECMWCHSYNPYSQRWLDKKAGAWYCSGDCCVEALHSKRMKIEREQTRQIDLNAQGNSSSLVVIKQEPLQTEKTAPFDF